ncbi:glycosyltransferase family 2 protein [Candidatus Uhrbacteria bacterium]|nr:glycosyltransferase family 2 protein [Candidatus Uhrbacteria bacterium]
MVTIAVCTRNRQAYLERCCSALIPQLGGDVEIITINDASTDGTAGSLASFHYAHRNVRIITLSEHAGVSGARNAALRAARGSLIVFTDDDCAPEPDWLCEITAPFADPAVVCVYGQVFYRQRGYRGYFPERCVENPGPRWPMTACIAYRTAALRAVGGFDPVFARYHNEDTEVALRLAAVGALIPAPRAIVIHQPMDWTCRTLLASARNASVWPILSRRYGDAIFRQRFRPPIRWRHVVNAEDYGYLLTLPLLIPILLIRYLLHGKRDFRIFFCKWPVWLVLRRLLVWREAVRSRVFMV